VKCFYYTFALSALLIFNHCCLSYHIDGCSLLCYCYSSLRNGSSHHMTGKEGEGLTTIQPNFNGVRNPTSQLSSSHNLVCSLGCYKHHAHPQRTWFPIDKTTMIGYHLYMAIIHSSIMRHQWYYCWIQCWVPFICSMVGVLGG
jgi:hypothetical protein